VKFFQEVLAKVEADESVMGDDALVIKYDDSCELTKNDLVRLLQHGDSNIALVAPEKFKSPIWERFRIVHYKGKSSPAFANAICSRLVIRESRSLRDVIDDWRSVRLGSFFCLFVADSFFSPPFSPSHVSE
jgi:hypothetical protein